MNHKIPCLLEFISCTHRPYPLTVDTGAGPNLVRQDQLPNDWETHQPASNPPEAAIRDFNGRRLNVMGHLQLSCRVGNHNIGAIFLVFERLAVHLFLRCDNIFKNVHRLQPGIGSVTLKDGSCYGALAMCMIGCAGPPTHSKIRMYHTLVVAPAFLAIFTIGHSATVLR
jgi:hypothetical protein